MPAPCPQADGPVPAPSALERRRAALEEAKRRPLPPPEERERLMALVAETGKGTMTAEASTRNSPRAVPLPLNELLRRCRSRRSRCSCWSRRRPAALARRARPRDARDARYARQSVEAV